MFILTLQMFTILSFNTCINMNHIDEKYIEELQSNISLISFPAKIVKNTSKQSRSIVNFVFPNFVFVLPFIYFYNGVRILISLHFEAYISLAKHEHELLYWISLLFTCEAKPRKPRKVCIQNLHSCFHWKC